jgi:hypothetical protein
VPVWMADQTKRFAIRFGRLERLASAVSGMRWRSGSVARSERPFARPASTPYGTTITLLRVITAHSATLPQLSP